MVTSFAVQEEHLCNRQCTFEHVCGNVFMCRTHGQHHVCDQTCKQRIFYDNFREICRLSKRLFESGQSGCEMTDRCADRKRNGMYQENVVVQGLERKRSRDR